MSFAQKIPINAKYLSVLLIIYTKFTIGGRKTIDIFRRSLYNYSISGLKWIEIQFNFNTSGVKNERFALKNKKW